jgi:putative flippase GtrA
MIYLYSFFAMMINMKIRYLIVGFIAFCANMAVLTCALDLGCSVHISLALGIATSTTLAFVLDRLYVFPAAKEHPLLPQMGGFLLVCLCGAGINYATASILLAFYPNFYVQAVEILSILLGTVFNYVCLRHWIFKTS